MGERLLALWSFEVAAFQLQLYDVEELRPLELVLPAPRHSVRAAVRPKMELSIPRLARGAHPAPVAPLDAVDEILMLGEPLPDLGDAHPPRSAIYAWEPRRGSITVYPQVWFTAETMDLGYQWITRIARDPATGRFVGGGFRIDDFELDETGTQIARRWPA
ncbi:MAG: hypothetical protein JNM84_05725 [Planctomycetes bacterium]|nr:hypothetical protein [Planctomycetota bacterium]